MTLMAMSDCLCYSVPVKSFRDADFATDFAADDDADFDAGDDEVDVTTASTLS